MKIVWVFIVLFGVATAVLAGCFANAQNAPAPKEATWEYKVLTVYEVTGMKSVLELLTTEAKDGGGHSAPKVAGGVGGVEQSVNALTVHTHKHIEKGLNKLGKDGWELAATGEHSFYFKRKRR